MKIVILIALTVLLTSGNILAKMQLVNKDESIVLISCDPVNDFGQAVRYSITFEKFDNSNRFYFINKYDKYRKLEKSVRIPEPKINLYDEVLIVTVDAGRSGYIHIYSNHIHNTHLFEVNLSNSPELNTSNPKFVYRCSLN